MAAADGDHVRRLGVPPNRKGVQRDQDRRIFTAATAGILISSLSAERLAKKYAQRTLIRAGFIVTIAGVGMLLAIVSVSKHVIAFTPGLLLIGLGLGVMLTPSVNIVQFSFPEQKHGEISGLSRSVSNLGSSLGTAIAGTILVADLANSNKNLRYILAMVSLAAIALIGLAASIVLPPTPSRNRALPPSPPPPLHSTRPPSTHRPRSSSKRCDSRFEPRNEPAIENVHSGRPARIAGTVYGTIIVMSILAAGAKSYEHRLWRLVVIAAVSVVVLWLAHVYAHGLEEGLDARTSRHSRRAFVDRPSRVRSCGRSDSALGHCRARRSGVLQERTAVRLALWFGVAALTSQGIRYAQLERLGRSATFVTVSLNLAIGLGLVALEVFIAH